MEEIDLKDLFNYFLDKLTIIFTVVLVGVLSGLIYSMFLQTPMYDSYTTIVLTSTAQEDEETSITTGDISLNEKLTATYREIIKSRKILNQVISKLRLDVKYEDLTKKISVTNSLDTEILIIKVIDEDPEMATKIANCIADVFSKEISNIYNLQNISIIDEAVPSEVPYNVSLLKTTVIVGVLFGAVIVSIYFVIYYFDTTIKATEEIETKIGLPILGTVPMSGKRKHKKGARK